MNRFVGAYPTLSDESPDQSIRRLLHYVATGFQYLRNQKKVVISGTTEDTNKQLTRMVSSIVGRNVVPVRVVPSFHYNLSLHEPKTVLPVLNQMLHRLVELNYTELPPGCHNPLTLMQNAGISGGTAAGVFDALSKMIRPVLKPDVPAKWIAIAVLAFLKSVPRISCPYFYNDIFDKQGFSPQKSAGFFPVHTRSETIDNIILDYTNTCKQGEAFHFSIKECRRIARVVFANVKAGLYDRNWFPRLFAKMSIKPEARTTKDDMVKTRIFFIMSLINLLMDKVIYKKFFENSYGQFDIGIAHKWMYGGAQRIANKFGYKRDDLVYFATDVTKLDQSLMASVLTIIFSLPLFGMTRDAHFDAVRAFMAYRADDIACTLVKWTGLEYRIVIGVMFSGLYGTSWGDSLYVRLAIKCTEFAVIEKWQKTGRTDLTAAYEKDPLKTEVYGDNVLAAISKKFAKYFLSHNDTDDFDGKTLGFFGSTLKRMFGFDLKESETGIYTSFLTILDPIRVNGIVRGYNIQYQGPTYLKRSFVDTPRGVLPWRPEKDLMVKALLTTGTTEDIRVWMSRWLGLIIDTMGTNYAAYNFLKSLYDMASELFPREAENSMHEFLYGKEDLFAKIRSYGNVSLLIDGSFPTCIQLQKFFLPNQYATDLIALMTKRPVYDEYGVRKLPAYTLTRKDVERYGEMFEMSMPL